MMFVFGGLSRIRNPIRWSKEAFFALGGRAGARRSAAAVLAMVALCAGSVSYGDCDSGVINDVPNCGFETGNPPDNWTLVEGISLISNTLTVRSGSASGQMNPTFDGLGGEWLGTVRSDCFVSDASTGYGFGAFFQLNSGTTAGCTVTLHRYSSGSCTGLLGSSSSSGMPTGGSWLKIEGTADTTAASSAELEISCADTQQYSTLIDDVFAGDGLTPVELLSFQID